MQSNVALDAVGVIQYVNVCTKVIPHAKCALEELQDSVLPTKGIRKF